MNLDFNFLLTLMRTFDLSYFSLLLIVVKADIQIIDLTSNPGILQISKGEAFIQKGSSQLTHLINLQNFDYTIKQIEGLANSFDPDNKFNGILSVKLDKLKMAYETIRYKSRSKRSWEALGSGIKWMAGNPDAEDLRTLQNNINLNTIQNNDQLEINSKFEDKINDIINVISNSISKNLNSTLDSLDFINLMLNIDLVNNSLEDIKEALSFSKNEIVSKNILGKNELSFVKEKLDSQSIKVSSDLQILSLLKPSVSYEKNIIHYRVSIPQIVDLLQHVIIQAIPKDDRKIKLNFNEVLSKDNTTFAVRGKCLETTEVTICQHSQLRDISDDLCVPKLLQNLPGNCIYEKVIPKPSTVMIEDDTIIVDTAKQPLKIFNTCGAANTSIIGTFLITFKNCSVNVNNEVFHNFLFQSRKPLEILPVFNIIKQKPTMDIHELHELHIQSRNRLHLIETQHQDNALVQLIIILTIAAIFILTTAALSTIACKYFSPPRAVTEAKREELHIPSTHVPSPFI